MAMSEPPASRTRLPPPPPPLPAAALGNATWQEQRPSPRSPMVPAGAVVPGALLLSAADLDRSRLRGNSLGDLLAQDNSPRSAGSRSSEGARTPKSLHTPKTPAGAVAPPENANVSAVRGARMRGRVDGHGASLAAADLSSVAPAEYEDNVDDLKAKLKEQEKEIERLRQAKEA